MSNQNLVSTTDFFKSEVTSGKHACYNDSDLNDQENKVIFATAGFYTEEEINSIVENDSYGAKLIEPEERYEHFSRMLQMDYDDLCANMGNDHIGTVLVLMKVKTWQGIRYGYKLIKPVDWRDILRDYECDDFAYYIDQHDLLFKGYHHDSDTTPNRGILRAVNLDAELTDEHMDEIMKAYTEGTADDILSKYTSSLRPLITKMCGIE